MLSTLFESNSKEQDVADPMLSWIFKGASAKASEDLRAFFLAINSNRSAGGFLLLPVFGVDS